MQRSAKIACDAMLPKHDVRDRKLRFLPARAYTSSTGLLMNRFAAHVTR